MKAQFVSAAHGLASIDMGSVFHQIMPEYKALMLKAMVLAEQYENERKPRGTSAPAGTPDDVPG